MSNVYPLQSREQRYDEASIWVARLDRQLSPEEEQAMKRWLAQHPDNADLLYRMAGLWDKMDALARLADLFPKPPSTRKRWHSTWIMSGLAASFLVMCVAVVLLYTGPTWHSDPRLALLDNRYKTVLGERSNINLPDGTRVVLNTDSVLRIKYTKTDRLLMLERGEFHVQVAHNRDRPLSVYVEGKIVQAVGTAFSVRINEDRGVKVLVTDGKVVVASDESGEEAERRTTAPRISAPELSLAKGELAMLGESAPKIERVAPEDIQAQLSWRQGNLTFRGEKLSAAIEEISRYSAVDFEFASEDIQEIRIAGLFKAGDIHGLLTTLQRNFGLNYQRQEDNTILLSREKSEAVQ